EDKLVTEISEELINSVAAKVEERQKQSKQGTAVQQQAKAGESDQRTLQALVAKLLLGEKNQPQNKSSGNNAEAVNPIIAGLDNASRAGAGQSGQQGTAQQIDNLTADTAAQVLAETQYELAKELEASLQKLRKVIEESKQVAQKINDLLGQDGGNKQQN
ncbi:MAG: hypothetical protein AAGU32_22875, partial [Bacillota bacterium]